MRVPKRVLRVLVVGLVLAALAASAIRAIPEGATVVVGVKETRTAPPVNNVTADGGNITEINISASTQTMAWQGFYGEVNGSIILADASGDLFYLWNITNISGEIYSSLDGAIVFASIFPENNCSRPNWLTGFDYSDSSNNTFINNTNNQVQVGNVIINSSTACAVYTYVSSTAQSSTFHELILTDDPNNRTNASIGGNTSVYATIINKDTTGYDGATHDYQLLVPVNRTAGYNTYAFYAELG
jgi:hypothetical protein